MCILNILKVIVQWKQEFGEEDMRRWWREQDFSSVFNEKIITSDIDADSIVEMIYRDLENEG